jgi:hypothetical protein
MDKQLRFLNCRHHLDAHTLARGMHLFPFSYASFSLLPFSYLLFFDGVREIDFSFYGCMDDGWTYGQSFDHLDQGRSLRGDSSRPSPEVRGNASNEHVHIVSI